MLTFLKQSFFTVLKSFLN